ncbi:hypothetical protein BDV26DRAFT_299089 [Aspergillus bertholletiae]|uniref:Uncharacterized protein n=1 Tax=Aspergillus bertholletiae TaxID=1226010 RepID=A0A5N7AQ38_9EURO|nr:hypothetical protein BDV26DRAFT_299089 [Aspergillus bertholletiae]
MSWLFANLLPTVCMDRNRRTPTSPGNEDINQYGYAPPRSMRPFPAMTIDPVSRVRLSNEESVHAAEKEYPPVSSLNDRKVEGGGALKYWITGTYWSDERKGQICVVRQKTEWKDASGVGITHSRCEFFHYPQKDLEESSVGKHLLFDFKQTQKQLEEQKERSLRHGNVDDGDVLILPQ